MKIDIQIDGDRCFQIESNLVPRIGDTLQIKLADAAVGSDIILPKVRHIYWNLLNLPNVSLTVFAETVS